MLPRREAAHPYKNRQSPARPQTSLILHDHGKKLNNGNRDRMPTGVAVIKADEKCSNSLAGVAVEICSYIHGTKF